MIRKIQLLWKSIQILVFFIFLKTEVASFNYIFERLPVDFYQFHRSGISRNPYRPVQLTRLLCNVRKIQAH